MGVVTVSILKGSEPLNPQVEVLSVDVSTEVGRIPRAEITLVDGDASAGKFEQADSAFFEPGTELKIHLRYEDEAKEWPVFQGVVVKMALEVQSARSVLRVGLRGGAIRLVREPRSVIHRDKSEADLLGEFATAAKLGKGSVELPKEKHPQLVQYRTTDWDFLLMRAAHLGVAVYEEAGKLEARALEANAKPKHLFQYGVSWISSLEVELDVSRQGKGVEFQAWDLKTQKLSKVVKAKEFDPPQGSTKGAVIAGKLGAKKPRAIRRSTPLPKSQVQASADGALVRERMALLRGRIGVAGLGDVNLLDVLELTGVGKRFRGKAVVTGYRHRVSTEGWRTDLQFGLDLEELMRRRGTQPQTEAGVPAVRGLQIGVVAKFEKDPLGQYRTRVVLPSVSDTDEEGGVWARLASPDAGKGRGFVFRPEVGDEVVVGFLDEDPRHPVILGSLFSGAQAPPDVLAPPDEKNEERAIVSRSGTVLGFYDGEKPMAFIETPGSNKILFDDDAGLVHLSDQNGNSLTLTESGIEMYSDKDIVITAKGNLKAEGKKVDIQ